MDNNIRKINSKIIYNIINNMIFQYMVMAKILENGYVKDHCYALLDVMKKERLVSFII